MASGHDLAPGRTVLVGDDKGAIIDIKTQDAKGWFSYKEDGCSVTPLKIGNKNLVVINVCAMAVDTYTFAYEDDGQIKLFFTQSKTIPALTKVAAFVGNYRAF